MGVLRNPGHERFAQGLADGLSAVEAWGQAGFKRNRAQACRARHRPSIAQRVEELLAQREAATVQATTKAIRSAELDAEWVLSRLMEIAERCMVARPVRAPGGQIVKGRWTFDAKGATKALDLLGKKLGLWRDTDAPPPDLTALLAALSVGQRTDQNGRRVYDA